MYTNRKNKGFTLSELLIVVAIIGVLVAISIPIFTSQLEKSREATDLANVRAAYAAVMADAIVDDKNSPYYDDLTKEFKTIVYLKQKQDGWTTKLPLNIGGVSSTDSAHWKGNVLGEGKCEVAYSTTYQNITLIWNGLTLRLNYQWRIEDGNKLAIDAGSYNNDSWPCNALTETLPAKNGRSETLTTSAITDTSPNLQKGMKDGYKYQIGFYIVDEDNNIIVNSGRYDFEKNEVNHSLDVSSYKTKIIPYDGGNSYTYQKDDLKSGEDIKIAVQVFKYKNGSSVKMSLEEARELEKLISIKKTK